MEGCSPMKHLKHFHYIKPVWETCEGEEARAASNHPKRRRHHIEGDMFLEYWSKLNSSETPAAASRSHFNNSLTVFSINSTTCIISLKACSSSLYSSRSVRLLFRQVSRIWCACSPYSLSCFSPSPGSWRRAGGSSRMLL
jgi:hypothetical protein